MKKMVNFATLFYDFESLLLISQLADWVLSFFQPCATDSTVSAGHSSQMILRR